MHIFAATHNRDKHKNYQYIMKKQDYVTPETSAILLEAESCVCASANVNPFEEGGDIILNN